MYNTKNLKNAALNAKNKKHHWVVITIAEPFPVFYAHADLPSEKSLATAVGPFYAANSKRYLSPEHKAYAEWSAAHLRTGGWTVTVTEEWR